MSGEDEFLKLIGMKRQKPSPMVRDAILDFVENGFMNWYPDINNSSLMKALSDYTGLDQDNISYFAGSDSIHEWVRAFIGEGDKLLILGPLTIILELWQKVLGAEINYFWLDENYGFNTRNFIGHMDREAQSCYLVNPNNPTGTEYDLNKLVVSYPKTMFIVDEAYYEFASGTYRV